MRIKVFLDTNVLLKGFAAFQRDQTLPAYLVDPNAERYMVNALRSEQV